MPINGLPTMLEVIINNLLDECKLSSYKIASNQQRSTLVLRFDTLADLCTSVSTNHRSGPVSLQRESPTNPNLSKNNGRQKQLRSGVKSMENSISATSASKTRSIPKETNTNSDDAIQRTSSAKNSITYELQPTSSPSLQCENYHNEAMATYHTIQKDSKETCATSTRKSNEPSLEISQPNKDSRFNEFNNLFEINAISKLCSETPNEIRKRLTLPDRNNQCLKLLLDKYNSPPVILAETDDMIVEYDMKEKKMISFYTKDDGIKCPRGNMCIRHMKTWKDESSFIYDECYDDYSCDICSLSSKSKDQPVVSSMRRPLPTDIHDFNF